MSTVVTNGYQTFTDTDGTPLEEGYIFIGEPSQNPVSNPKSVFFDADLSIPATDIRTSGGYPVYQGSPARLYTDGPYSILVQNRDQEQVYLQLISLNVSETQDPDTANPDLAGGLPLGSILPLTGVTFTGFLALGTAALADATYPDLAASGNDYVSDNGDGTFDLLDSGESDGWVANNAWDDQTIAITHDLVKNMTDLDIEVFVSEDGDEATAIKVLDTAFDQGVAAAEFSGVALQGIGNASFNLRTGTDGVSIVNLDGTQLILVDQSWYYKVNIRRKDAPYPGQISYVSLSSAIDGGDADGRVIAIRIRRDSDANWTSENPVLLLGEGGYETDTEVLKLGDGTTAWNTLNPVNTNITANLTGITGTDRTVLEDDSGVFKVSLGSVVEADGTLYTVAGSAATPSGTQAPGVFLFFDPSSGLYTWSATAGTFNAAKGGIYDGSDRRQCHYYLSDATFDTPDERWNLLNNGPPGGVEHIIINIGGWDMNADAAKAVAIPADIDSKTIRGLLCVINHDNDTAIYPLPQYSTNNEGLWWELVHANDEVSLKRDTGSFWDSVAFDNAAINRGWVTLEFVSG